MAQDNQSPELFGPTPFQTVGPFFHYSLPWKGGADLIGESGAGARPDLMPPEHDLLYVSPPRPAPSGEAISICGRVFDGQAKPVPDALLEIWQANAAGTYGAAIGENAPFIGFGRCATSEDGVYRFHTVRPGSVHHNDVLYAPHIAISLLARGILRRLVTRLYFEGDPANAADPVLALVPEDRRSGLMARREDDGWAFDIFLQGEQETVFFQC